MPQPIRIGVLGAARVTQQALYAPARHVPEVAVTAIAARDRQRAEQQARKRGVPRVHDSYQALLADPEIDAVYIPLPNSLHCEWSIRALEAGKHVLCEKPIACNSEEARQMAAAAERTGRVLIEAMHSRYHPLHDRVAELLREGVVGEIRHVEAHTCFVIANGKDIRWQYAMGGGALMDLGVYGVSWARFLAGEEPTVPTATVRLASPNVDRWIDARLAFPSGASGRILCSMWGWPIMDGRSWVEGNAGKLVIDNPTAPQLFYKIELQAGGKKTRYQVKKKPGTYELQLAAFARAIQTGEKPRTGADYFIANMAAIDAIYRAAGLSPRGMQTAGRS